MSLTKGDIIIYEKEIYSNYYKVYYKKYKFIPINHHSLSSFYEKQYYSIEREFWVIVGVKDYKENDKMTILFSKMDKNIKLYNYFFSSSEFINFYSDCSDGDTTHYLFINHKNLQKDRKYYFNFYNLVGSEPKIAQISKEEYDFKNFNYSNIGKFNYFTPDENNLHIIKFQCSGKGNKILANIRYYQKINETELLYLSEYYSIYDFPFTFGNKKLTVDYSYIDGDEFDIQIFTPNGEKNKYFDLIFENNKIKIMNDESNIIKISDKKNFYNYTIESNENIETIVSIKISGKANHKINPDKKYLTLYTDDMGDYFVYEIEHEFNTNYNIDFEIKNSYSLKKICYLVSNIPLLYYNPQNCFLLNTSEIKNISLHNIFKYSENEKYNLDKQKKYYLVIYGIGYSHFNDIYFKTDLPISQSINKFHTGHNYQYLEASLEKNVPSYFNVDLLNIRRENNINLYIINKTEINYNQLQFDIKCIIEYEPFLDAIKPSFNESNNLCFVINKDDFNSNIFHIIFNDTQKEKHEKLILRIIPKINMNIKLFTDKHKLIYKFYGSEAGKSIEDSFVHQIYEINKDDFSKRIIYNKHYKYMLEMNIILI